MRTSGYGNDALMILVPAGVLVGVSVVLTGGPSAALETMNALVRNFATAVVAFVGSLL